MAHLFSDAELREDLAQHVLDIETAGKPRQRIGSFAQMLGGKLWMIACIGADEKSGKRAARALDFLTVPRAGDERSLMAAIILASEGHKRRF